MYPKNLEITNRSIDVFFYFVRSVFRARHKELLYYLGKAGFGRIIKRAVLLVVYGVHVCALFYEHCRKVVFPSVCRANKRCFTVSRFGVYIRARIQKRFPDKLLAVVGGNVYRKYAVDIRNIRLGAGGK